MKNKLRNLILPIIYFLFIPFSIAQNTCQKVASGEGSKNEVSAKYQIIDKNYLKENPRIKSIEEIAAGSEGTVYKVIWADGTVQALKKFKGKEFKPTSNIDSLLFIKMLLDSKNQVEGLFDPQQNMFNVVTPLGLVKSNKQNMVLEYIEGDSLHSILLDTQVPSSIKLELFFTYQISVENLIAIAKSRDLNINQEKVDVDSFDYKINGINRRAHYIETETRLNGSESVIRMDFKPDNIIVNLKTLEMTIVDPY